MLLSVLIACLADLAPEGSVGKPSATDADGDGFAASSDCDDDDPTTYPGATELCDQVDNDCNTVVDDVGEGQGALYWPDEDGDAYGDGTPTRACTPPLGHAAVDGDCEDSDPRIHPGADEICDDEDNDCDGTVDQDALDATFWYVDQDGDGWGVGTPVASCEPTDTHRSTDDGDCDDVDDLVHPGMTEACDAIDNNCDGWVDEGEACPCYIEWSDSAYMFCNGYARWPEARSFCEIYGYTMLTVNDSIENDWVTGRLETFGGKWWAGYNDRVDEDEWVWESGQTTSYSNWDTGQPNNWWGQDCLVLNDRGGGKWNDAECDDYYFFVCES